MLLKSIPAQGRGAVPGRLTKTTWPMLTSGASFTSGDPRGVLNRGRTGDCSRQDAKFTACIDHLSVLNSIQTPTPPTTATTLQA